MEEKLEEALKTVKEGCNGKGFDEDSYLSACEYLVDHKDELTQRVYIQLPGGLGGNYDTQWNHIKQNSESRCSCGNERVILPRNPRTKYEPSDLGEIVVSLSNEVYLKPVGGDKESTYIKLWIKGDMLAFLQEPFAPLVVSMDMFSIKGFGLKQLEDVLSKNTEKPVLKMGKENVSVFAINKVDTKAKTVTITPDKAVELYSPETDKDTHECK